MQNKNHKNLNSFYRSSSFSKNALDSQQDIFLTPDIYSAYYFSIFLSALHFGEMTLLFLNKKK